MSKINVWSPLLGGCAVTASCLSFIFMSISICLEVGQLDKYRPTRRCHMRHFFLRSKKNERLLIFFFLSGECEPPKNVLRKFHREKITNMASVSCVCSRSAMGSRWTSLTAYAGPAALVRLYSQDQIITHFYTPNSLAFHNKPLTPTWAKANKSKSPLSVFTSQTFTWGASTQIRSFSSPDPNIEGNLFQQRRCTLHLFTLMWLCSNV